MQTLTQTPYQPIVYAIPREDWVAFLSYMKTTSTFQPTLFNKLTELQETVLTVEDWNVMMEALNEWSNHMSQRVTEAADSIVPRVQELLQENKELLLQDGKTREQFFSRLNIKTVDQLEDIEDMLYQTKRWIICSIAASGIVSTLLSTVICLLMR